MKHIKSHILIFALRFSKKPLALFSPLLKWQSNVPFLEDSFFSCTWVLSFQENILPCPLAIINQFHHNKPVLLFHNKTGFPFIPILPWLQVSAAKGCLKKILALFSSPQLNLRLDIVIKRNFRKKIKKNYVKYITTV